MKLFGSRPRFQEPLDDESVVAIEESEATGLARQAPAANVPSHPDLIARVLGGDAEAFRGLVEAHERAVFGLCRRLSHGNDAEAEDLTQETFLRAYERLDQLDDRTRFTPWLFQIARSLCRDRRRRREIEARALERRAEEVRRALERPETSTAPGAHAPHALEDLPPDERQVLELRYFEGLSYDELTRRVGLSFSQVDHLIRRARARLARRLLVRARDDER